MPRNTSGAYNLPAGNPVQPNSLIETGWANPTLADIAASLTESLDRYGRGGMLAPFKIADGTVSNPGLGFASESSSGLVRTGPGAIGLSVLGILGLALTSTALAFNKPATFTDTVAFQQAATFAKPVTFTDTVTFSGGTSFAGSLGMVRGSVALPGLYVVDDADTGLYSPAPHTLAVTSGGVERMRVDSNGHVNVLTGNVSVVTGGIGVTSGNVQVGTGKVGIGCVPNGRLDVQANGPDTYMLRGYDPSGVNNFNLYNTTGGQASLQLLSAGAIKIQFTSTGGASFINSLGARLGIGTDTPASTLDVNGDITLRGNLAGEAATRAYTIGTNPSLADGAAIALYGSAAAVSPNNLIFYTGGIERMRVSPAGNVGVARTPAANVRLDILGVNNSSAFGGNADVRVMSNNQSISASYGWNQIGCSGDLLIGTGGVERMRIDTPNGNVGIGAAAPAANRLWIEGPAAFVGVNTTSADAILGFARAGTMGAYVGIAGAANGVVNGSLAGDLGIRSQGARILFSTNSGGSAQAAIDAAGVFTYQGIEVGWRGMPLSAFVTGNLAPADIGKLIKATAGVTVQTTSATGVNVGDWYFIYNATAGNITVSQGASTALGKAGTSSFGNFTLATNGTATLVYMGANLWIASGAGIS